LTALDLQEGSEEDTSAVLAAIAALPELQSLRLPVVSFDSQVGKFLLSELQHPSKLTHLSVGYHWEAVETEQLGQLSALVNLKHLDITSLPETGLPGGLPSQLQKLTCLQVKYPIVPGLDSKRQLQHVSCLMTLQHLAVSCYNLSADGMPGVQHLSHLSSFAISSLIWDFSITNTSGWTSLAALESLTLSRCQLRPQALAVFTQLRKLSLEHCRAFPELAPLEDVLAAVSQLHLLTELHFVPG
jgi:hypothetical protein